MEIPASPTTTALTTSLTTQAASSGLPVVTVSETAAQTDSATKGGLTQLFSHLLAQLKTQISGAEGQTAIALPGEAPLQTPTAAAAIVSEISEAMPAETEKTDNPDTDALTISEEETAPTVSAVYLQSLVPYVPVVTAGLPALNTTSIVLPLNSTKSSAPAVDTTTIDVSKVSAVVSTTPSSYVPAVSINTPRTSPEQRLAALTPEPITGPTQKQADTVSAASPLPSATPDNAPSVDATTVSTVAAPAAQIVPIAQQAALPQTVTVSELNVQNLLDVVQADSQPGLYLPKHSATTTVQVTPDTPIVPNASTTPSAPAAVSAKSEVPITPVMVAVSTSSTPPVRVAAAITQPPVMAPIPVGSAPQPVQEDVNTAPVTTVALAAPTVVTPEGQTISAPVIKKISIIQDTPVVLVPREARSDRHIAPATETASLSQVPAVILPTATADADTVQTVATQTTPSPIVTARVAQSTTPEFTVAVTTSPTTVADFVTPEPKQTANVAPVSDTSRPAPQTVATTTAQSTPDPKSASVNAAPVSASVAVKTERPTTKPSVQTAPRSTAPSAAPISGQTAKTTEQTATQMVATPARPISDGNVASSVRTATKDAPVKDAPKAGSAPVATSTTTSEHAVTPEATVVPAPRAARTDRDIKPSNGAVAESPAPTTAASVPAVPGTKVSATASPRANTSVATAPSVITETTPAAQTVTPSTTTTGSIHQKTKEAASVAPISGVSQPLPQTGSPVSTQGTPDPKPDVVNATPDKASAPVATSTTTSEHAVTPEATVVPAPRAARTDRDIKPSNGAVAESPTPTTATFVATAPNVSKVAGPAAETGMAPTTGTGSVTPETKPTTDVAPVADTSRPLSKTGAPAVIQTTPDPKPAVVNVTPGQAPASVKAERPTIENPARTAPRPATPAMVAAPRQTTATERSVTRPSASNKSEVPAEPAIENADGNGSGNTTLQEPPAQATRRESFPVDRSRPNAVSAVSAATSDAATAPLFSEQVDRTDQDKTQTNKTQMNKTQPETTIAPVKAAISQPIASATAVSATDVPVEDMQPENRHIAMARPTMTSPESTTASLSTSHHPGSEEKGDAAPSERRDSSDARHLPHIESETSNSAGPVKPADTLPIEKSIERSVEKAAAPQPATQSGHDRVRVVEQVTQKIETLRLTHGRQEAIVHLRPDNLGDLRLTIVTDRDTVTAHVVAETTFARQAVEEGRDHLRAALEQKGFSLQGLDVSLNQSGGHNANDRRFMPFDQSGQPQARSYRNDLVQETAPVAPSVRATSTNAQTRLNGRVDYTA